MTAADLPTWEFRCVGGPSSPLSRALFVRDVCDLPVPRFASLPPRMTEPHPVASAALCLEEQREAAIEWRRWWLSTVDLHVRLSGGYCTPRQSAWRRDWDLPFEDVGAGPSYEGLADRPALRKAVLASVVHWPGWVEAETRRGSCGTVDPYWPQVTDIADAVIAEHAVSPALVRGLVFTVPVQGTWWSRWSPGVVVCTRAAACDEPTEREILRDVFASSIA